METTARKFRMSDFVKDGYLAKALRLELEDLSGAKLELAQEAIIEVATSGITGTFDELSTEYRRAIRRVLHPERKIVRGAKIDRSIMKNAQVAAMLDRELEDVTKEELARANAAVKKILDEFAGIEADGKPGEERFVEHPPTDICRVNKKHSTLGQCGYFKDPAAWPDVFRAAVREAIGA